MCACEPVLDRIQAQKCCMFSLYPMKSSIQRKRMTGLITSHKLVNTQTDNIIYRERERMVITLPLLCHHLMHCFCINRRFSNAFSTPYSPSRPPLVIPLFTSCWALTAFSAERMDASALRNVCRGGGFPLACGCQGRTGRDKQGLAQILCASYIHQGSSQCYFLYARR